jgi:DNA-binding CsgD family transcriptional regulator
VRPAQSQLAVRAFDAVHGFRRAASFEDLERIARPLFEDLGFPSFAAARFYSADGASSPSLMFGETGTWGARYFERGYSRTSSIARAMLAQRGSYCWSDIAGSRRLDPGTARILGEARSFGFTDGLYVPMRSPDGSYAAVALCGAEAELKDPFVRTVAEVLAGYYGAEGGRLSRPRAARQALSRRQRECLAWVRQGKSSADISAILGLSAPTVDGHIAEACRKLGVRTRIQAVVEACLAGYIDG